MIRKDKIYHLIAGFIIQSLLGSIWVIIAAFGKEFHDDNKYGGWDWADIAYTLAGAFLYITIKNIIDA